MKNELRILILEDDEADAELIKHELKKANIVFKSQRVQTRDDFQKKLFDFEPDLILADYTLPAFDGSSALRMVKEKYPDIPFIFVSGTIGEDFAIESLKSGATDYVLKDRLSRLVPAVDRALSEAKEKINYRNAQKALEESELRFRSVVESANDAIILTDGKNDIISWNKSAATIFGYLEEEVMGKSLQYIMPWRDDIENKMRYSGLSEKSGIIGKTIETYGLRKDDSKIPLEISIATWNTGDQTFYSVIMRDITERKRAEEVLIETKSKLQALVHEIPDMVIFKDVNCRHLIVNKAVEEFTGMTSEYMVGKTNEEILPPDIAKICRKSDEDAMRCSKPTRFEEQSVGRDGKKIVFDTIKAPIHDAQGNLMGLVMIMRDITERKKAEEMLKEKARAELYGFIVSALPVFARGVPSQVRNNLVKNFAERFETNIRPRFQEEMKRLGYDQKVECNSIEDTHKILEIYLSWLAGLFSSFGVQVTKKFHNANSSLELLNCPWRCEARGNPIFCFICRTIVIRSFTWTSLKGSANQNSSIAGGSKICVFEIHVKSGAD